MNVLPNNFAVATLKTMYEGGSLVLRPEYQRGSVWNDNKRSYFVDSILKDIPIPKILLEKRIIDDNIVYCVLDGQQRLNSLFSLINGGFKLTKWCPEYKGKYYSELPSQVRTKLQSYLFTADTVSDGTISEIRDIYVRLNTGGVKLNDQEIRYAKYNGEFKQLVYEIEENHYFRKIGMFNDLQVIQMNEAKFISSLLIHILNGDVEKDDKPTFDKYYEQYDKYFPNKDKVKLCLEKTYKEILSILPDIDSTIFKDQSRFYPLFAAFYHFINGDKYTLGVSKSKLKDLLMNVHRNFEEKDIPIFRDFNEATSVHTNNIKNRKIAKDILIDIISIGYIPKDPIRLFSEYQKQYLWHLSNDKKCGICGKAISTYKDVQIDHIVPWSLGGQTILENAQLAHDICNMQKQNIV